MIKRLKNKLVIINMSIALTIAISVFVLIWIFTYNSQSSFLLLQLDEAITQAQGNDKTTIENTSIEIPSIYSICVFVDKGGKVTKFTKLSEVVKQVNIEALVEEATENGHESGYVNSGSVMFLKKDSEGGSVFAFASTETMDNTVSTTVVLTLAICLSALLIVLIISDRLSRYTVKPIKAAWDSQISFVDDVCLDISLSSANIFTDCEALISHKKDTVKSHQNLVDNVSDEATKITNLIMKISDLAKSKNSHSLTTSDVNLSKITSDEVANLEPIANTKRVLLCPSINDNISLNTNKEAYLTIVNTLIMSAINYSHEMEKIRISLHEGKKHAYLYVNTPTYIENDVLTHIFECVRGEHPTEEVKYSYGLAIAKNLAISLHGDLKVKSEPVVGTTFILSIKKK